MEQQISQYCWLVGCALPANAASLCRYLFEKESNRLKPQLKTSLINSQLYAAALSNIFSTEKVNLKSFIAISKQLKKYGCDIPIKMHALCEKLEITMGTAEFREPTHLALINCLMQFCIEKLAPAASIIREIDILGDETLDDVKKLQSVDVSSPDFVTNYALLMGAWMGAVTRLILPQIQTNLQISERLEAELPNFSLITLLCFAVFKYRSQIDTIAPKNLKDTWHKAPCLDSQLAGPGPINAEGRIRDDQSNAPSLLALLGGIAGAKKGSNGKPDPSHWCLLTAAQCVLSKSIGSSIGGFENLAHLCAAAACFHVCTKSDWNLHPPDQSPVDEKTVPLPIRAAGETALRNSVALKSLVRTSGGLAKKVRPNNPENIAAALVDLRTVEQLVSTTTADPAETVADQESILLNDLACTAALAAVGSTISDQKIQILSPASNSTSNGFLGGSDQNDDDKGRMTSFFLVRNRDADTTVLQRSSPYATFKMVSPSKTSNINNVLSVEESSDARHNTGPTSPKQDVVSTTQPSPISQNDKNFIGGSKFAWNQNPGTASQKCWSETARLRKSEPRCRQVQVKNSPPTTLEATQTGCSSGNGGGETTVGVGGVAATTSLRLSLDQRRRAIEANRMRALRAGDRAAADRHQAAFLALLHSSQKRRQQTDDSSSRIDDEQPSSVEKETVSQSDQTHEQEEEVTEDCPNSQRPEGGRNTLFDTKPMEVEASDMEDLSSVCAPERVGSTLHEEPLSSTSPKHRDVKTPPTPVFNPHHLMRSPPSVRSSSSSIQSDYRSPIKSNNLNHNHSRSQTRCPQCNHCNPDEQLHRSFSRRRPKYRDPEEDTCEENEAVEEEEEEEEDAEPMVYRTLPVTRRVKSPRTAHSVKNYARRNADYCPEDDIEIEHGDYVDEACEAASDIYWSTTCRSMGHRRPASRQRINRRYRQIADRTSSGEEDIEVELDYSYPGKQPPRRPRNFNRNRLGKSAGTGLDALAIDELARSVTTLRSDIERLTAQQKKLLRASQIDLDTSSAEANHLSRSQRRLGSAHSSSRIHLATTPGGSTRAMWNTRVPLSYPSQGDVHYERNGDDVAMEETSDVAPDNAMVDSPVQQHESLLNSAFPEPNTSDGKEDTQRDPTTEPEPRKPSEQLFIAFQDPGADRMQRARERLEARRAAERTRRTESALRTRLANQEAEILQDISRMAPTDPPISTDPESDNSGFPVHTPNESSTSGGDSGSPPEDSAKSTSVYPNRRPNTSSASSGNRRSAGAVAASTTAVSRRSASLSRIRTAGNARRENGAVASGVAASVDLSSRPKPPPPTGRAPARTPATTRTQRSASRQVAGRMTNGQSLSSLHRLENGEESTYSGPGLPIGGMSQQTRLFVKPKSKSNRLVIVNAISYCCLAGTVNEPAKKTALQELAAVDGSHFMVLFRDDRCQYRALYAFDSETEELNLICGSGPRKIHHEMCNKFFKYNSGAKQFSEITSTKHLSAVVDAITIQNSYWLRAPPPHSSASRASTASAPNG